VKTGGCVLLGGVLGMLYRSVFKKFGPVRRGLRGGRHLEAGYGDRTKKYSI
jgi:hypothetical protein